MGGGGVAKIAKGKKSKAKQERAQKKICLSKEEKKAPKDNVVKATMDALSKMRDALAVARQRGISLDKVFNG